MITHVDDYICQINESEIFKEQYRNDALICWELKGSDVFLCYMFYSKRIIWLLRNEKHSISFEKALDLVLPNIQENLLFNLNLFTRLEIW